MALLYDAEIRPSKLELLGDWLPSRAWYAGPRRPRLVADGAYRFDDPQGEVGIETHLVHVGDGPVLQVPLTYRGAPLPGGDGFLVGTMEHSVLGQRWVYDACGDPVYAAVLATVILGAATQAEQYVEVDGGRVPLDPTVVVRSTVRPSGGADGVGVVEPGPFECSTVGDRTRMTAPTLELTLLHVLDVRVGSADEPTLLGTWEGQPEAVRLATARRPASG